MNRPSAGDVLRILRMYSTELISTLKLPRAHLSLPTDGKGVRIRLSVLPEDVSRVPPSIQVSLDGRLLTVPLEAVGDYQDFEPLIEATA